MSTPSLKPLNSTNTTFVPEQNETSASTQGSGSSSGLWNSRTQWGNPGASSGQKMRWQRRHQTVANQHVGEPRPTRTDVPYSKLTPAQRERLADRIRADQIAHGVQPAYSDVPGSSDANAAAARHDAGQLKHASNLAEGVESSGSIGEQEAADFLQGMRDMQNIVGRLGGKTGGEKEAQPPKATESRSKKTVEEGRRSVSIVDKDDKKGSESGVQGARPDAMQVNGHVANEVQPTVSKASDQRGNAADTARQAADRLKQASDLAGEPVNTIPSALRPAAKIAITDDGGKVVLVLAGHESARAYTHLNRELGGGGQFDVMTSLARDAMAGKPVYPFPRNVAIKGPNGVMFTSADQSVNEQNTLRNEMEKYCDDKDIPVERLKVAVNCANLEYVKDAGGPGEHLLIMASTPDYPIAGEDARYLGKKFGNPPHVIHLEADYRLPHADNLPGGSERCYDKDVFLRLAWNALGKLHAIVWWNCIKEEPTLAPHGRQAVKDTLKKLKIGELAIGERDQRNLAANFIPGAKDGDILLNSPDLTEKTKEKMRMKSFNPILPPKEGPIARPDTISPFGLDCMTVDVPRPDPELAAKLRKERAGTQGSANRNTRFAGKDET